ncbi:MAG: gluconate 2-dehydrogenase subunit 3 family protein [Halioglobus sp.]|nr:gluconate 2-dehydrogenase subunit 3 family protein [Halioglobus sp.]
MNRREFLQCAAIMVSGVTAAQHGFSLTEEQQVYLATAPDYNSKDVEYFSPAQKKIVAAMAEVVIPRTDTPGAIDAGVPQFIELLAADWLNAEERAIFEAGLTAIETEVPQTYGKPFDQLDTATQLKIMEELEGEASDSDWYKFGNVQREFISDAPFICQIKELTIYGFFTSEVGSKQVLRYDPMPMAFDGNYPLSKDDSSWAGSFI